MYANISHEFRTPLTIIKGMTGLLKNEEDSNHKKRLLKNIDQSNDQLLHLVDQMLDLASLDANKLEAHYKNADVIAFIKKSVELYRSFLDSKQIGLEFHTNIEVLRMDFDDDKLQKILNNLLSNAIKFTPDGGKIQLSTNQQDNNLKIVVSDTGKGIKKGDLPHVFERYYKTYDIQGHEGTGIGLSLTSELVNLLGGTINVKSKKNNGTTFTVILPIKNVAAENCVSHHLPFVDRRLIPPSNDVPLNNQTARQTILLVEDNKDIQNFIRSLLLPNFNILTAHNGLEGLKIANMKDVDFILSDVMMPKMDGFEFCKKIKSQVVTSHIPFVMVSARTHTQDKQQAYKLGVDAYLTKPFNIEELKLLIDNLLRKQKEQKQDLLQLLSMQQPVIKSQKINKLDFDLIRELQAIILNDTSKLSAAEVAKQLLMSRTQLHRKVKALTGKSLTHYSNHIRIEKAKYLLKTSELQIKEIAYSIGFESSTYFIRLFKSEVGTTPEDFRNNRGLAHVMPRLEQ
jgi:DNA-binding response OmpR family regulator/two-component sensor histidine kinase